ncbi:unnamed protein product, partial [Polarella glacialis]
VNRDLLEYWDGKHRRKREMQRAEEKSKEKALEDLTRIAQFEKHRQERQEQLERTKQRRDALDTDRRLRALSQLDGTGDGEAEDDGQMEQETEEEEGGMLQFWQADGSRKQTFTPHAKGEAAGPPGLPALSPEEAKKEARRLARARSHAARNIDDLFS